MPRRRGEVMRRVDQIVADCREVVIDALPMGLQSGLMPSGTKLAAASNVGEDEYSAALQPELADGGRVARRLGKLKTAIGCQQRRICTVVLDVIAPHDKIRHFGSIL